MFMPHGVLLVQLANSSDPAVTEKLKDLLEIWTLLETETNFDKDLKPANDVPGYLTTVTDSGAGFYVPVNLVRVSPKADQRAFLEALSRDMKVRDDFEVCLSGSGTFLGITTFVGDLDFAEYFTPPHEAVVLGLRELKEDGDYPTQKIRWIQAYFPKASNQKTRREGFANLRSIELAINAHGWRKLQIGAAADLTTHTLGDKEITNMVVPTSAAQSTSPFSYVYQEIVMTEGSNRPQRSLTDQAQINGYFEFLNQEARIKLAHSLKHNSMQSAAKALKRAISLIMLLSDRSLFAKGLEILPTSSSEALDINIVSKYVEEVLEVARKARTIKGSIDRMPDAG